MMLMRYAITNEIGWMVEQDPGFVMNHSIVTHISTIQRYRDIEI